MMTTEILMAVTLLSIWLSILLGMFTLAGAVKFWLKNSQTRVRIATLRRYPTVSIVVPAHNEALVIGETVKALLRLNYPSDKIELLLYSDNSTDDTTAVMKEVVSHPLYASRQVKIINRQGTGGKAGVLNDALKIARGEYIAVYDADAMPEANALYFLVKKILEDPKRYVAAFGRNKTRNAKQNFLTRCINQEIIVTQRIQHIATWEMFRIGRIPGTNFIVQRDFVQQIGGWRLGALTEDTDISFKIMQTGKLIALAYNSEAFQQEPEHLRDYYYQRLRWAKGNYQVVLLNDKHLFDHTNWRVKLEVIYYTCTYFWFNAAIILSNFIFLINFTCWCLAFFNPTLKLPFALDQSNIYMMQVLLLNWVLMVILYMLQINIAMATQYGQATTGQIWLSLLSYFTYSQLFIVVSLHALLQMLADKLLKRDQTHWVKTKRFID
ncbi:glycosyl transferase, group 2 family protein [Weissella halotolerans DSM 20190]|uniref:Glycosyl transferase, group 2 family protein n=2 Tax=Weissella halotolerans TaxID=1615 RepID=A0A0R2G5S2_9LACO|nr:glycosyl transferase, group 2 family protein [Weissella halotolerans DSM 20190]